MHLSSIPTKTPRCLRRLVSILRTSQSPDRVTLGRSSPSKRISQTSAQAHNPLHGVTLAMMLERLVAHYGWDELGKRIPIRCFTHDPSLKSSLSFLRKTEWARARVEALYLSCHQQIKLTDGTKP
ncbi:MAG TPA: VF530 family protein [Planctomycetaceae bacterium]|nr:VF530 family protein [Planctomycetaceae bacterium]